MAELILDLSHLHLHAQDGQRLVSAEVRVACAPDAPGEREPRRATLHLSFSPSDLDEPLPRALLEALEPLADVLTSEGPRAEDRITVHVDVDPEASPETKRAANFLHDLLSEALADENSPLRKRLLRDRAKRMLTAAERRIAAVAPPVLESFSPGLSKSLDLPHAAPPPATRGHIDDVPSPEAPLSLNAWFPEHPADPIRLPVGLPAVLRVNLGPPRDAAASQALPPDVIQALLEVPFIDVLILCAGADIQPLRRRLQMPPDPAVILEFILTPRRPGPLEIQIVLLVHNEPIHRMPVPVEATAPASASAPAPVPASGSASASAPAPAPAPQSP